MAVCGEGVACLTIEDLLALSVYLGDVAEVKESMASCPYVVYRD